ncbi:MAG: NUDIX domain-containing protein [Acidobacteria bacterium]|nr:NUDIX domain-containing protein [Acidobacteriota bacterium]
MIPGYEILEAGTALVELTGRGRVSVQGSDRVSFLHAVLTNDIASLSPGQGCYAAYLTPQGRMISDMIVLLLEHEVLLDIPRETTRQVVDRFDRSIFSEDVRVRDATEEFEAAGLYGVRAPEVIARASSAPADLAGLHAHSTARAVIDGHPALVARADIELGPGFTIYAPRGSFASVLDRLKAAGATSVHPNVLEVRRIEAGLPAFGVDMDEHTIPLEAGIEARAISLTKGCYPGQEVIIRVLHRGHGRVAKKLVGLTVHGDTIPATGDPVYRDDEEVGRVTRGVFSPSLGTSIAMAYLRREHASAGTDVSILHERAKSPARVTALPFVDFTGRPHVTVVAAVIEREGRYLVTRRLAGVHLEGFWEFPGGKCEDAEPLETCLRRELREELGVEAVVSDELLHVKHRYPDRVVELHFFRCALDGEPRPLLGQEMQWAAREDLDHLQFPPADGEMIARLMSGA